MLLLVIQHTNCILRKCIWSTLVLRQYPLRLLRLLVQVLPPPQVLAKVRPRLPVQVQVPQHHPHRVPHLLPVLQHLLRHPHLPPLVLLLHSQRPRPPPHHHHHPHHPHKVLPLVPHQVPVLLLALVNPHLLPPVRHLPHHQVFLSLVRSVYQFPLLFHLRVRQVVHRV